MWLRYANGSWQVRPLPHRGERFGDGVFETVHVLEGRLLFAAAHLQRLRQACLALDLRPPLALEVIFQEAARLAESTPAGRLRLVLYREGAGGYTPSSNGAVIEIGLQAETARPFPLGPAQRLILYPTPFLVQTPWSSFKTLSSVAYVQAAAYAQAQRCDDALLLSVQGHLAETSRANLFFWDGQVLRTPSLRTGCVAGILRQQVLQLARTLGLPTEEGLYPYETLLQAQEVFTTNVIQGIAPVLGLHGTGVSFRTGPDSLAAHLSEALSRQLSLYL